MNGFPTILNSGNGYHIIQPIECPMALEKIEQFKKYNKPSQEFLRFAECYLSNGKADKNHNPSFNSCLLRIPNSINSKCLVDNRCKRLDNSFRVKIVQRWNGYRPLLVDSEILYDFQTHLIQNKINEQNHRQKILKARRYNTNNNIKFWIEKLLNTPITDFRKNALSLILAPYLIHIKKLSYQESFDILSEWLKKCDSIRKLDFNSSDQVCFKYCNSEKNTSYEIRNIEK